MDKFAKQIEYIRQYRPQVYRTITLDLTTARSEVLYELAGNYILILEGTDASVNVKVRFNETSADQLTFTKRQGLEIPFYRFFLSNDAQAGKSITIIYGINDTPLKIIDMSAVFDISSIANPVTVRGNSAALSIYNITCVLANTTYSQALPSGVQRLTFKPRVNGAYVGLSDPGTNPYVDLSAGQAWYEDSLNLTNATAYVRSTVAGTIVEVLAWV